jgi:hypothetical protein
MNTDVCCHSECELARHALRAVSHWADAAENGGGLNGSHTQADILSAHAKLETVEDDASVASRSLEPSISYVTSAFDGYYFIIFRNICMHMYICMYICIFMYICTYIYIYVYVCICIYVYM